MAAPPPTVPPKSGRCAAIGVDAEVDARAQPREEHREGDEGRHEQRDEAREAGDVRPQDRREIGRSEAQGRRVQVGRGGSMLHQQRYCCYCVAGTVGLMALPVRGVAKGQESEASRCAKV